MVKGTRFDHLNIRAEWPDLLVEDSGVTTDRSAAA
jgi:hypothetical protein